MTKVRTSLVAGLITLVAGFAMVFFRDSITSTGIVVTGGVLFIVAALFNALLTFMVKNPDGTRRSGTVTFLLNMIASAAALSFGVCMLMLQDKFEPLIPVVFAVLVLFGALMLFYAIAIAARPILIPGWVYLFAVAMVVGAIMIFRLKTPGDDALIMLYSGISLMVYGVASLIIGIVVSRDRRLSRHLGHTTGQIKEEEKAARQAEREAKKAAEEAGESADKAAEHVADTIKSLDDE